MTLGLDHARITDAGLVHLERLTGLEKLSLSGTQVTDKGLVSLKGLAGLRRLFLLDATPVTRGGATTPKDSPEPEDRLLIGRFSRWLQAAIGALVRGCDAHESFTRTPRSTKERIWAGCHRPFMRTRG